MNNTESETLTLPARATRGKAEDKIKLPKEIKLLTIELKGTTRLIMHSNRGADPLHPLAKQLKTYTDKKQKTEDDHLEIARLELRLGVYWDDEIGLCLPADNLFACFLGACKKHKLGPKSIALTPVKALYKLTSPKVASLDDIINDKKYWLRGPVKVAGSTTIRTRPVFHGWGLTADFWLDTTQMDVDRSRQMWTYAGPYIGIGDSRPSSPKKPLTNGKFLLERFDCE